MLKFNIYITVSNIKLLKGKSYNSCWKRWNYHLQPLFEKFDGEKWQPIEYWIVYLGQQAFKQQWHKVASFLKNKTGF